MGKDIFSKKSRFSIRKLNIGVCSVLLGTLIMIGHTAQADETTSDGATVATTAVSASQGDGASTTTPPITAPESAATTTVAPAATETVTSMSVAPTTSVAPSVAVSSEAPASTSATSSAPASSAATSTSPVVASEVPGSTNVSTAKPATASEASRSVTASTASVTTASSENAIANNVTVSETANVPRVRRRRDTGGTSRSVDETRLDRVTVTKDNFDSFFKEGGTANYDETSGTIKLTDDVSGQVGSAYLRFKIDPREDFTFTGKVDIGDKYEGHTVGSRLGGDGVGFVFHTGNVDTIGQSGASVGMGTIKNAFGFKLDSWHNTSNPNANQNASADPRYGGNAWRSNAFGSFYSSNNAGRVTTSSSAAKALNPKPNGEWVDFKIEYKGQSKEFIVTYGSEKWSTNLKTANASIMEPNAKTALNNSNATYALSFLGSTGSGTNLQRVQIEKFEFTAPQIVQVAFYDEAGNELAASSAIPGDRDQVVNLSNIEAVQKAITKLKTKGYTLKEVNSDKAETYNSGANTVTLRSGGQLLKYVFAVPTPEVTKTLPSDGGMLRNGGIKSTDRTLSGTGTPGATINIKVAGNTVVDNVTVESNGKWTATLPTGLNSNVTTQDQLVPKDSLVVTQKIGVSESEAATVDVALGESSVVPSTESKDQQSIVAETTTVTLKVPHDAGVTYFDYPKTGGRSEVAIKRDSIPGAWASKDASKAVVTSYSTDGFVDTIVLEMKEQIQPGKAKVISNIKETKYSSPVGWKEINVEEKPDTTPPVAPTVNSVKVGATNLTGTAEANSTVEATLPNGSKVTATAGSDGSFTIPVSGLNEGDTISVTATDAASNKSTPSVVTVKENVRPVVNIPYDDKANQIIYLYSGEENNIELKVTDNSGKIAKAFLVFAQDNRTGLGTEDAGYLNGKTKSALYLKANRFGSETTATEANPAIIKLTANIPNGSYTDGTGITRYVYAEDLAGNTNYDNVGAAGDTGAPGRIRFVWKPQTFKYNSQAPSTPITSSAIPEASAIEKAVKDANPTFSDKIGSVSIDGTNVKVTYKDGSTDVIPANSVFTIEPIAPKVTPVKNPSSLEQPEKDAVKKAVETANPTATRVEVGQDGSTTLTYSNGSTATLTPAQTVSQADVTPPVAPTVNPVTAGATAVTGTAEAGSTVEVTLPDGSKATATADPDGNFSVPVSALKENDTVSVTAKDASNNTSTPTTVTVPDTTAPVAPTVNPVTAGATAVTGTAEAGSTVEVTLPDGSKATATADPDGNFSVPVSALKENDTVSVTAKDASNNTSTPTTVTVPDTTAPVAPTVNPVTAGATAVTGTAEAGSTVEVTLPDGSKATATA
ncbi:Ig-like domain-containing protein, partial [Streptococcus salivarius]|uniref:Ig-like domain-containing protein n=2 Tax=Streptococcus salivarius TaxID=1304 RepID=UPI0015667B97